MSSFQDDRKIEEENEPKFALALTEVSYCKLNKTTSDDFGIDFECVRIVCDNVEQKKVEKKNVDTKAQEAYEKGSLVLEVVQVGKPGWLVDEGKKTDILLFSDQNPDTRSVFAVDFCAFREHLLNKFRQSKHWNNSKTLVENLEAIKQMVEPSHWTEESYEDFQAFKASLDLPGLKFFRTDEQGIEFKLSFSVPKESVLPWHLPEWTAWS